MIIRDIPILAVKSFRTAGGGGSSGVSDVNITDDGHLLVTIDGQVIDKGEKCMTRAVYDKDDSGIVDNSEKVGGFTVLADVPENVGQKVTAEVTNENLSLQK